jgi:hypothetical protein
MISNGLKAPVELDAYNYNLKDFKFTCKFGDGNHLVRKAIHKPTRTWMAMIVRALLNFMETSLSTGKHIS